MGAFIAFWFWLYPFDWHGNTQYELTVDISSNVSNGKTGPSFKLDVDTVRGAWI